MVPSNKKQSQNLSTWGKVASSVVMETRSHDLFSLETVDIGGYQFFEVVTSYCFIIQKIAISEFFKEN